MVLVPDITEAQLRVLDDIFPDKLPQPGTTPEQLAILQGQRQVIERLYVDYKRYFEER